MAKTKQTAGCSGASMQQTTFSDQPVSQQFKDINEEDILDVDDPTGCTAQQAVQ